MNPELWGNPAVQTFARQFVRSVKVGTVAVRVHKEISPLVATVIRSALSLHVPLPEKLDGWLPYVDGYSTREYGLAFGVPEDAVEIPEQCYVKWGFVLDGGLLVFAGSPEEAKELAVQAEEERVTVPVPAPAPENTAVWFTGTPGEREVFCGDKGDDVHFWQIAVGSTVQSGVFDEQCVAHAAYLQARLGTKITGTINEGLWRAVIPTTINGGIEYGSTGRIVRILQAALVAYDWVGDDFPVTGRFDALTMAAVKALQRKFTLRESGKMGRAEWAALLGRPLLVR